MESKVNEQVFWFFSIYPVFWAFPFIQLPLPLVTFLECHRMFKCPLESYQQDSDSTFGGHISIFRLYQNDSTMRPPPRLQGSSEQDCVLIMYASLRSLACHKISEWAFIGNELSRWLMQDRLLTVTWLAETFIHQRIVKNAGHWC